MTKKLLALLLTVFMVLAVATGCNSNPETSSVATGTTESTGTADAGESDADATDSTVSGGAGETASGTDNNSKTESAGASVSTNSTASGTGATAKPNGTTSATQSNGATSNTSSGTASTTKPTTLRGTTVKFATWIDVNKTEYGPVIQAFTKKTGIRVKIVNVPQHEYITKLTGLIASGNSPDVINDNSEFPRTIGITQPITVSGINPNDSIWNPIITEMSTINGKTYLVSSKQASFQTSGLLYFNKTLFANNGIKSPEQYVKENNWNWNTFNKAASDIKNAAGIKLGCVFDTGVFTSSYGAGFVKYKKGKFYNGIDESILTDTWRFLQEGVKSGIYNLGAKSQFVEGQAGMCVTDTYGLKKAGYFSAMKNSDLGVTYLPKKNATDKNYPRGGFITAYGIAKGAQNAAGAGEFLKFYLNMDNYDTNQIYKTPEFTSFAKEVIKIPTTLNTVYWDDSLQDLTGQTFNKYVIASDPSQIEANLEKVKNTVNAAVKKANDMLATAK